MTLQTQIGRVTKTGQTTFILACLIALALLCTSLQSHARSAKKAETLLSVAKVMAVTGSVRIISINNTPRPSDVGTIIQQGDSIITQSGSSIQLRMLDNSLLTLREQQNVNIDDYWVSDDPIGEVMFLHGEVELWSQYNEKRPLKKGGSVFQGDRIKTAAASSAQIKMVDQGYFAVRPNSEVEISEYIFNKGKADRVNAKLITGGLRSITGIVGKTNKQSFQLNTPVATIGIRGTDLVVFYVPEADTSRGEIVGEPQQDGLVQSGSYLQVLSGEAVLANQVGVQAVKQDEVAFTSSTNALPVSLEETPPLFTQPTYEEEIKGVNVVESVVEPAIVEPVITAPIEAPAWQISGAMLWGYRQQQGAFSLAQTRLKPHFFLLNPTRASTNTYSRLAAVAVQADYQKTSRRDAPHFYGGIEHLTDHAQNVDHHSINRSDWLGADWAINDRLNLNVDYQQLQGAQNKAMASVAFMTQAQQLQLSLQAQLNESFALTYHLQNINTQWQYQHSTTQTRHQAIGVGFSYSLDWGRSVIATQFLKGYYHERNDQIRALDQAPITRLHLQIHSQLRDWLNSDLMISDSVAAAPSFTGLKQREVQWQLKAQANAHLAVIAQYGWRSVERTNMFTTAQQTLNALKLQFQF